MPGSTTSNDKSLTEFLARQATVEIAVLTAEPSAGTPWASLSKADYTGYADQTEANTNWTTPANSSTSNTLEISYPANSGGGSSSSLTHFAVRNGATGDDYRWATLNTPVTVAPGESMKFAVGALILTDI